MKVGGNCGPQSSSHGPSQAKGGSGEKFKAKGGSGESCKPNGCGSGEKAAAKSAGIPYGQYKKQFHEDSFAQRSGSGGSLVGNIIGGLLGGWGNNSPWLNNYAGSTPQAVEQKNQTPTVPVADPAAQAIKNANAKALPGISQMDPAGKDANYTNPAMNCGPTVLAMIGDAFGKKPAGMTDAQYINALGAKAGTTDQGTTGNGMIAALNDMGFETAATKGANLPWINQQLNAGHEVIANGDYYSLAAHPDDKLVAGHYVAVTGYNDGLYTVNDPANGQITQLTAQQLSDFIAHHPEGGFAMATWPEATGGIAVG